MIKPTTTVTGIHLEMTVEEALRIVSDKKEAARLQENIASMLNGLGFDLETGTRNPDKLAAVHEVLPQPAKASNGKKARLKKAKELAEAADRVDTTPSKNIKTNLEEKRAKCPWCGHFFSVKGIKRHMHYCDKRKAELEQESDDTLTEADVMREGPGEVLA